MCKKSRIISIFITLAMIMTVVPMSMPLFAAGDVADENAVGEQMEDQEYQEEQEGSEPGGVPVDPEAAGDGASPQREAGGIGPSAVRTGISAFSSTVSISSLFPDAALAEAIAAWWFTGDPDEQIDPSDLASIAWLNLDDPSIRDLTGLSLLTGLEELNINGAAITSLEDEYGPIGGALEYLIIQNCKKLTSLDGLDSTPNLSCLIINNCERLASISALSGVSCLDQLQITHTSLESLHDLDGVDLDLSALDLSYNKLTDANGLSGLTSAYTFDLSNNRLISLDGLPSNFDVYEINVSNNRLASLPALPSGQYGPSVLYAANNQLTDISALMSTTGLEYLDLAGNQLTDVRVTDVDWDSFTDLYHLDLSKNRIAGMNTINAIKTAPPQLWTFLYYGNPLGLDNLDALLAAINDQNGNLDLSGYSWPAIQAAFSGPTRDLTGLRQLNLSNTGITDGDLPDLYSFLNDHAAQDELGYWENLDLSNNQITSVSALKDIIALLTTDSWGSTLNLNGNHGIDLTGIASLNWGNIRGLILDLSDCGIENVEAFGGVDLNGSSFTLYLNRNRIADISPLRSLIDTGGSITVNALNQQIDTGPLLDDGAGGYQWTNHVKGFNGNTLPPENISHNGTVSNNVLTWTNLTGWVEVSYDFEEHKLGGGGINTRSSVPMGDGLGFSGTVTLPYSATSNPNPGGNSKYHVYYDINGGTGATPTDASDYSAGDAVTVRGGGGFSRSGYTFTGWNTARGGTGTGYQSGGSFPIHGDVTLYAQWRLNDTGGGGNSGGDSGGNSGGNGGSGTSDVPVPFDPADRGGGNPNISGDTPAGNQPIPSDTDDIPLANLPNSGGSRDIAGDIAALIVGGICMTGLLINGKKGKGSIYR